MIGLRFVSEKNSCQDENGFITQVVRQHVRGELRACTSWRRYRAGTGPHPGCYSVPQKNGESQARARYALAAAQYIAAQLLITKHPVRLSNARERVFVH